jgi:wyosine [tRNA(Phe)-imidazoG37] synthetase (radical SAM superfamily)
VVSDKVFRKLNRPEATMKVDLILSGLHLLRQEYRGQIWLEILILAGYNDSEQELEGLAKAARELQVERVQVHTASRPSPENEVEPAPTEVLRGLADAIGPHAEVVGDITSSQSRLVSSGDLTMQVLNVVRKRPGRVKDVSVITGADDDRVAKVLKELTEAGRIRKIVHQDDNYFIGV